MRIAPCDNLYTHLLDRWCAQLGVTAGAPTIDAGVAVIGDVVVINNQETEFRVVDGPCGCADDDCTRPTPDAPADDGWPTLGTLTTDPAGHHEPAAAPAVWGEGEAAGAGMGGLLDVFA